MNKRVIVCLVAMGVGCGGTPAGSDAAMPPSDSGGPGLDATAPPSLTVAPPNTLDLSCRGRAMLPMGGAATMATLQVNEYLSTTTPIADTMIDVFRNGVIGTSCAAPNCTTVTTSASGAAMVTAPLNGLVGFHIHTSSSTAEVLAYGMPWSPMMGVVNTAGFSSTTISTVSALLLRTFNMATAGAISGQVTDCMGRTIGGAEARVFMGTTQIVTGPNTDRSSPRITGLAGTMPTRAGLTGMGGTFVGANVPAGDTYHVEIWGTQPGMAAAQLIGCEEGRVVAGGISVLAIGPLRMDYATGSACAMAAAANP